MKPTSQSKYGEIYKITCSKVSSFKISYFAHKPPTLKYKKL